MKHLVTDWLHPEILQLSAYHVPHPGQAIKLNTMENPYRWEEALLEQWLKLLPEVQFNRYPDSSAHLLKQQLREVMQIPPNREGMLGNGSDELIQMLVLALRGTLLIPEPSFVMYRHLAQVAKMPCVGVPLTKDFQLDSPAMLEAIDVHQPALIFLACPNNPTGTLFKDVEAIIERAPGIVVIDEAYAPFTDYSFMSRLNEYDHVLVMRTVSKWGLAGLRLGFLVGPSEWINQLEKVRQPYNINTLTQLTARFALQHYALFKEQTHRIRMDRQHVFQQLYALPNVQVWPSEANFLLFKVSHAEHIFHQLKERNILIKCVHGRHPLLEDCLQVTIGTPQENETFIHHLAQLL